MMVEKNKNDDEKGFEEPHDKVHEEPSNEAMDGFDEELRATAHTMREQMHPSDEVVKSTVDATLPPPNGAPVNPTALAPVKKRRRRRTWRIFVAAAAALVVIVGGIVVYNTASIPVPVSSAAAAGIITPGSYDEVYESLESRVFRAEGNGSIDGNTAAPLSSSESSDSAASNGAGSESVESSEAPVAGADVASTESLGQSRDYSETNTQVEGVDEADIVKTDGENIYSLYYDEVIITQADGVNTKELSRISVSVGSAQELYVAEDRLIIISTGNDSYSTYSSDTSLSYGTGRHNTVSYAEIYDISNPSNPQLLNVFGQDGATSTSRLMDGMLYVVSNYTIYSSNCERGEPETFIPNIYHGSEDTEDGGAVAQSLSVENIRIMPEYTSASYTVLTAIDIETVKRVSELSVLGYATTVYMSEENLYLAATSYDYGTAVPLSEDGIGFYTESRRIPIFPWELLSFLIDPDAWFDDTNSQETSQYWGSYQPTTRLTRVALDDDSLDTDATTIIDGTLLNQFSLDEYDGYLRVAITETKDVFEENGSERDGAAIWIGTTTTNSLLVFDSSLSVMGSIEDMAPGERIYSARFSGDVGYMVTFRQVDPLFSLDLSNPRNPKVMDALKIPGFSQYLHPYSDSLLLGLGQNTSSSGTTTGELKLSMFNVSDPFNINEASKFLIDASSSDALYNHKAVLIDENKNIIGFSVSTEVMRQTNTSEELYRYEWKSYYMIYGYDEGNGFYERAVIELPEEYESARALYIDGHLYIVNGENIGVFSLDTLEEIIWITVSR